ncbi:hypothetical protein D030_4264A, partial [Vibrio parahaemolyticus AQ3810]
MRDNLCLPFASSNHIYLSLKKLFDSSALLLKSSWLFKIQDLIARFKAPQ